MPESINPYTQKTIEDYAPFDDQAVEATLAAVSAATSDWAALPLTERCASLRRAADVLDRRRDGLAQLITDEMGKLLPESKGEIEKCATVSRYYADHAADFLADLPLVSDARRSFTAYQPLGTVFAVMPWNFPFWQVFRCAAPSLAAGNTLLLKHASNVTGCALAIEDVFRAAGFPKDVMRTLVVSGRQASELMADDRIHAGSLTGSEAAGSAFGGAASKALKPSVLELGGSDPFIVLSDADLDQAAATARKARYMNAGQSCIAAKRFIVMADVFDAFLAKFKAEVDELKYGDPNAGDSSLAPMAREDLRDELHELVTDAVNKGATLVAGGGPIENTRCGYQATILTDVDARMKLYREEAFGPVAAVYKVNSVDEAIELANATPFGLGGCVWTQDEKLGERVARQLDCGCAYVNQMVASDPRLPFGGIKVSGYGRELSKLGIHEFVNAKTISIA